MRSGFCVYDLAKGSEKNLPGCEEANESKIKEKELWTKLKMKKNIAGDWSYSDHCVCNVVVCTSCW